MSAQPAIQEGPSTVTASPEPQPVPLTSRRFELPPDKVETPAPAANVEQPKPDVQNNEASATSAEPEAKPDTSESSTVKAEAQRQRSLERKIERLYRARGEAEAETKALRARVQEYEERIKAQTQPRVPSDDPKLEDFDYDPEKYAEAKAQKAIERAAREAQAKQNQQSQEALMASLREGWNEQTQKAEEKYDDWDEAWERFEKGKRNPAFSNPNFDAAITTALMEESNGADVAYHLGTNEAEMKKFAKLSFVAQLKAIGRLSEKLSQKPVEKPQVSKAPAPIEPLQPAAAVRSDAPSEEDSMADWMRKRNKQVHGSRRF